MSNFEKDWEEQLAKLLVEAPIDPENQPLALKLDKGLIVPLRLDSKLEWSPKRATWRDLTSRWVSVTAGLNPTHLAALKNLFERFSRGGSLQISDLQAAVTLQTASPTALRECYETGVEIFADPQGDRILVPRDQVSYHLDIISNSEGLELKLAATPETPGTPDTPGIPDALAAPGIPAPAETSPFPEFKVVPSFPRETLQRLKLLPPEGIRIPLADTAIFWAQWAERPALRQILTPEARHLAENHSFQESHLEGILEPNRKDSRLMDFRWNVSRTTKGGDTTTYPLDAATAGQLERDLFGELGKSLGMVKVEAEQFFSRSFPVWELSRLRELVARVNSGSSGRITIDEDLDKLAIYSEIPDINLEITDAASGGYHLDIALNLGGERLRSADFLPAWGRHDRWWQTPAGNWVDLFSSQNRELQQILQEFSELGLTDFEGGTGWNVGLPQLGLVESLSALATTRQLSPQWKAQAAALLDPKPAPLPTLPEGTWRPYQEDGFQWLYARAHAGLGGILADDMGLGKTLQMLAVVASQPENSEPILAVVPASLLSTWQQQAAQWFPSLRVVVQATTIGKTADELKKKTREVLGADLVVTTYTLARIDMDFWETLEFSGIILDEAQAVKNPATATHKALTRLRSRWAFALTGTPVENREKDLWSILALTVPQLLPPLPVFERRLSQDALSERAATRQALGRKVWPFLLRRTKEAVASDLPPKIEQQITLELEPTQQGLYDKYLTAARLEAADPKAPRLNILTALTRLRQLSLSARLINPEIPEDGSKITYLMGALSDLASQQRKILVFSQFTSFLKVLRQQLDTVGTPYSYLDGTSRDREKQIADFQDGPNRVFLISLKAGGFGLNLTEADYVFLCDPWWNPAVEAQAIDRAHRLGQTRAVNVYRLVAANTIEERVLALQEKKRELIDSVLSPQENREVHPQITLEELRSLLD
ncbi:DEAD/DEAH box helicase [Mobiluncus porci]|uniref:DEAD/DEAH box helicase n=1 Tax=Mobiluncus porci TaxID=2652278 RepID=A0A7K0K4K8_9ACTO|nr:DEAD/DEAH box helicase [Mobiluncus porci]MST50358.1 DEAD/DEAH box helicase [Mobiluncus porci]